MATSAFLPADPSGPRVGRSLASPRTRARVLLAALIVLLLPTLSAAPASAQKLKQPGAAKSLRALVLQTNAPPAAAAPRAKTQRLARAAKSARRSARGRPCASVRQLARYRTVLRGIRVKKGRRSAARSNRLAALGPAAMNASRALLAKRGTRPAAAA